MVELDCHYHSGDKIRAGDHVACGNWRGVVKFVLATRSFAPGFSFEEWSYLGRGFMVEYDQPGLVFSEEADADVVLLRRS